MEVEAPARGPPSPPSMRKVASDGAITKRRHFGVGHGMLQRTTRAEAQTQEHKSMMDDHRDYIDVTGATQRTYIQEMAAKAKHDKEEAAKAAGLNSHAQRELHRIFGATTRALGGVSGAHAPPQALSKSQSLGAIADRPWSRGNDSISSQLLSPQRSEIMSNMSLSPRSMSRASMSLLSSPGTQKRNPQHTLLHMAGLYGLEGGGGVVNAGKIKLERCFGEKQKEGPMAINSLPPGHRLANRAEVMLEVVGGTKGRFAARLKKAEMSASWNAASLDMHRGHLDNVTDFVAKMQADVGSPCGSPKSSLSLKGRSAQLKTVASSQGFHPSYGG